MDEKNILITGGAGFIGARFIQHILFERNDFHGNIINLDKLTYAANKEAIEAFQNDSRYTFIEGDICDKSKVRGIVSAYDIHIVMNFAAETHVDRSIVSPRYFIETNVMGTFTLLDAIRKMDKVHFHQISTDEVFGSCPVSSLFTEKSHYNPQSPYSASKAAADHLVQSYANTYGVKTTISYCTNNFGPGQDKEKFIPKMIDCLINKKPMPIYAKGENIRDWLYVDDHIEALYLILTKGKIGSSYAIGARNQLRNIDVVHTLIDLFVEREGGDKEEYLSLIDYVQDRPGHDFCYGIDPTKIENELGYKPKNNFKEALSKTIDWYKDLHEEAFLTF